MHNKEQSRAPGVSNCSFSCFVLGTCVHQAEERVEEDLAGFLEIYIVLAQIDGCLLGVSYKVCPRSSSPVSTNYSVYTLHVRIKGLTYS